MLFNCKSGIIIKNIKNGIFNIVSDLLVKRQNETNISKSIVNGVTPSNADELKKYKGLLDSGVITQEEFEAKKKQLLGL